ncbi:MAG: c-type cytochrome [Gemmatimonadota bacterium]
MRKYLIAGAVITASTLLWAPPAAAQGWSWPDSAENLQVLPADFSGQRIRAVMTGFTRTLGVRCSHCHVGEEGQPLSTYDFPSDENPKKNVARTMLKMLGDINQTLNTIEPSGERVNMWCGTCHRGRPRAMTIEEELDEVHRAEGLDAALAHYDSLRERFYGRGSYDFGSDRGLNSYGYTVLGEGDVDGAIRVFQKNVELIPESANAHDSLGEAYMERGDRDLAIASYETSLSLNPQNTNARKKLQELRAQE